MVVNKNNLTEIFLKEVNLLDELCWSSFFLASVALKMTRGPEPSPPPAVPILLRK